MPQDTPSPALTDDIADKLGIVSERRTGSDERVVKDRLACLGRSPDTATPEELRSFQLHLTGTGVRPPTMNTTAAPPRKLRV